MARPLHSFHGYRASILSCVALALLGLAAIPAHAQTSTRIEAELFTGDAQWQTVTADGITYRIVPNSATPIRYDDAETAPRISYTLALPAAQYKLRGRFSAGNGEEDSLWVRVNAGPWIYQYLNISSNFRDEDFETDLLAHTGGNVTIDVACREDGARLDWVEFVHVGEAPNPGVLSLGATQLSVREDAGKVAIDVVRTGGSLGAATVAYQTVQDTATPGSDYTGTSAGTVSFASGQTQAVIEVPILNDTADESDERFGVSLNGVTGANLGEPRTAQITILDDDSSTPDPLLRQAENFTRVSPWRTAVSGSTTFAHVPNGAKPERHDDPDAAPKITDTFSAPAGPYSLRARVRAADGADNSFWLRINGGEWFLIDLSTSGGSAFNIQALTSIGTINHPGGVLSVQIAQREAGTAIDWIEVIPLNVPPPLPAFGVGKVELEAAVLQNLVPTGVSFASGGTIAEVGDNGVMGSARFLFNGPTGVYNLELAYFDENDGAGVISIYVGATKVLGFNVDATNGGPGADAASYRTRVIPSVNIPTNAEIKIEVSYDAGEYGRVDYLNISTTVPDNGTFSLQPVITGLNKPTAIDFAAGGLMFIAQQNGVVRVALNNQLLPTPFVDLSAEVNGIRDRGLLGLAVHPEFPNKPYVYLAYTYDPPQVAGFPAGSLGGPDGMGNRCARVVRLTAAATPTATSFTTAVPDSQVVILGTNSTWANISRPDGNSTNDLSIPPSGQGVNDFINSDSESHTIGALEFAPDGSLFVAIGDGTSYGFTDPRTARVQSLDSLSGKIVRINPDNGQGYATNPFYNGDSDANRSKIFAYGLRNPFRIASHPINGKLYIGDVGWTKWEEINRASGGENFGWPWYEGKFTSNTPGNEKTGGYMNLAEAQAFYQSSANNSIVSPTWAITHANGGRAVVCGDFYTGAFYPTRFRNMLFMVDYGVNILQVMFLKADGSFDRLENILTNTGAVMVEMSMGPDGYLYIVDITGRIHRVTFQ